MELTELVTKFTTMLKIEKVEEAPQKLLQVLFSSKNAFFDEWIKTFPDLSVDNLQPIFSIIWRTEKKKCRITHPKVLQKHFVP